MPGTEVSPETAQRVAEAINVTLFFGALFILYFVMVSKRAGDERTRWQRLCAFVRSGVDYFVMLRATSAEDAEEGILSDVSRGETTDEITKDRTKPTETPHFAFRAPDELYTNLAKQIHAGELKKTVAMKVLDVRYGDYPEYREAKRRLDDALEDTAPGPKFPPMVPEQKATRDKLELTR